MSFLIVKTSALGDIVHTFPAAAYLAERGAVDWVVEERFADVLRAHPAVRRVILFNRKNLRWLRGLRAEKYDALFDLQGNCKSGLITALARARQKVGFSLQNAPEWPNALATRYRYHIDERLPITAQYLSLVQAHFGDTALFRAPPVTLGTSAIRADYVICFGSSWPNKQLAPETLLAFLKTIEAPLLLIYGSDAERAFAENSGLPHVGGLSVPDWQGVMAQAKGVIAVDSSGLHLAAAAGVPTFSLFGPSSAAVYAPQGSGHVHIQGNCPYGVAFTKRCPHLRTCATGACLKQLTTEALTTAFRNWEEVTERGPWRAGERRSRCGSPPAGSPH